jgi:hypothetical protein
MIVGEAELLQPLQSNVQYLLKYVSPSRLESMIATHNMSAAFGDQRECFEEGSEYSQDNLLCEHLAPLSSTEVASTKPFLSTLCFKSW